MKENAWFAVWICVASGVSVGHSSAEAADTPPSLVESYTYPGADAILAEHGLKVLKGDGHVLFVTSRSYDEGQCEPGQIQVEQATEEPPYGSYFCFETRGSQGFLTLDVPGTVGVRSGSAALQVKVTLPGGDKTYSVAANGYVATSPGAGAAVPQATLVALRLQN